MPKVIQVAAGVLVHPENKDIFICKRLDGTPYEGFWEYPGGKIEPGETAQQALARELDEEIGVRIGTVEPLITIRHDYPDRSVRLQVFFIHEFEGQPWGKEGQETAWVPPKKLKTVRFLEGNRPITDAVILPRLHAITDLARFSRKLIIDRIESFSRPHIIQVRDKHLDDVEFARWAKRVVEAARFTNSTVMLNRSVEERVALLEETGAHGLHLDSRQLSKIQHRPIKDDLWLSASCHNAAELNRAEKINTDFVLLSPVMPTASHPSANALGWAGFSELCATANLPVFALGGLGQTEATVAWKAGAQGIAGITGFWNAPG